MCNNKSFLRIVVAIAICLAGMVTFSGCKKNDFTVPPSRVENFTATTGDGEVCLKWNAPLNTNGKITGYEITMDNWTNKVSKNANQFSHTYSNLTNNTEYRFKVRALNVNGAGTESILTAKPSEFDGIFVGTYTSTNLHNGFTWNHTLKIEFENGKFKYNRDSCTGLCCCSKGNFTIMGSVIIFKEVIN